MTFIPFEVLYWRMRMASLSDEAEKGLEPSPQGAADEPAAEAAVVPLSEGKVGGVVRMRPTLPSRH